MVDNQLTTPIEEIGQRHLAIGTLEEILLLHLDHGQLATRSIQPVACMGGSLLLGEQLRASNEPLIS